MFSVVAEDSSLFSFVVQKILCDGPDIDGGADDLRAVPVFRDCGAGHVHRHDGPVGVRDQHVFLDVGLHQRRLVGRARRLLFSAEYPPVFVHVGGAGGGQACSAYLGSVVQYP